MSVAGASLPQLMSRAATTDRPKAKASHLNLLGRMLIGTAIYSLDYVRLQILRITGGVGAVHNQTTQNGMLPLHSQSLCLKESSRPSEIGPLTVSQFHPTYLYYDAASSPRTRWWGYPWGRWCTFWHRRRTRSPTCEAFPVGPAGYLRGWRCGTRRPQSSGRYPP